MKKHGLGLIKHAGRPMVWGKGARAGGFIFLSGTEARSEETDEPLEGMKAQTILALERVKERLAEAGASLDDVVKFVWYVRDRAMAPDFFEAREGWLSENAPTLLAERSYASTFLVAGLEKEDMLVEVDCIAYVGD